MKLKPTISLTEDYLDSLNKLSGSVKLIGKSRFYDPHIKELAVSALLEGTDKSKIITLLKIYPHQLYISGKKTYQQKWQSKEPPSLTR